MPEEAEAPPRIAVVIPVGPLNHHTRWLRDCLKSVVQQERAADSILLVDDMRGREEIEAILGEVPDLPQVQIYQPPWRLGVGAAFNHGVAMAFQEQAADLAVMLGADDTLELNVLGSIERAYLKAQRADGYYWSEVLYSDGRQQVTPCNCAAVTPGLWAQTGGFPLESSTGAPDAALISILMIHNPRMLRQVPGRPAARFIHRVHDQQETRISGGAGWVIPIRDWLTRTFEPPAWGRYG